MEPLYSRHHWEPTFCPLQRGVPNSGGSSVFPVGVVLRNQAVEHVAAFSSFGTISSYITLLYLHALLIIHMYY